jgi:hypothetical protein
MVFRPNGAPPLSCLSPYTTPEKNVKRAQTVGKCKNFVRKHKRGHTSDSQRCFDHDLQVAYVLSSSLLVDVAVERGESPSWHATFDTK